MSCGGLKWGKGQVRGVCVRMNDLSFSFLGLTLSFREQEHDGKRVGVSENDTEQERLKTDKVQSVFFNWFRTHNPLGCGT